MWWNGYVELSKKFFICLTNSHFAFSGSNTYHVVIDFDMFRVSCDDLSVQCRIGSDVPEQS